MKATTQYIVMLILALPLFVPAQQVKFPVLLRPGDNFTVQDNYDGVKIDSLWLVKNRQLLRLINNSIKQKIDSSRAALLSQEVGLLKEKSLQLDSLVVLQKSAYERYRVLWEKTDHKLEQAEINSARNLKLGFLAGVGVSAAIVIFLGR